MPGLTKKQGVTKSRAADMRCTVAFGGAAVQIELLHAISCRAMEAALYADGPYEERQPSPPPRPTEDGTYLLINNIWVPE